MLRGRVAREQLMTSPDRGDRAYQGFYPGLSESRKRARRGMNTDLSIA